MSDFFSKDLILYNPLSEITRRERRALLGLSVLAIAMVKVPLVPEKIGVLGLEMALKNQQNFLFIFALVLCYFVGAFFLYALTDYFAWRRAEVIAHHDYTRQDFIAKRALGKEAEERMPKAMKEKNSDLSYRGHASYHLAAKAARLRAWFEFVTSLFTAGYAVAVLLH
jgi:hypothetical protein